MNVLLEIICQVIVFIVEVLVDDIFGFFFDVRSSGHSELREWLGFLGASAWLVVSMGRIKWENHDWRAFTTGVLLVAVGAVFGIRALFGHPPILT
ncbi:MAG: hypothetical protein JWO08_3336 [Verrucomicrobiaceae bacterium]|nr:hypothetical protein [Verrucomicrobiaceae bacterium]